LTSLGYSQASVIAQIHETSTFAAGYVPALCLSIAFMPASYITVECLRCRHKGRLSESNLLKFGINPSATIASFAKRLRCRKCGSGSVRAKRMTVVPDRKAG
jgi:hypothetical protein